MSRASSPDAATGATACAGFTLLEVLVALAVAAAVLAAIGQVMGANGRGARALEARAGLISTARAVEAGIPARSALALGRTDGDIAGHGWRMDVRPLAVAGVPDGAKWAPRDVVIRVRAPSGAMVVLETVRLVPVAVE
ncbi:prepilin-type N-terminal cleavage/methylation domain-containing protein [Xanthobacter oligotrophicus]|uniref:prepilin-type N-terminal cleavage/methylation domain-containing protein n=1 Tax=Xanthobacter oligotrophicus TaxID=2607286 RepID=UPI0011F14C35|nr:prepilin-type N-terminal cleavage/methylation domain-containing protein [Xanthobacter oligotrophicus]MCG5234872.1 prepilin-type N-terminal cleavage/methylation domain-containing protein [Xanthobacter oligotrophicus]